MNYIKYCYGNTLNPDASLLFSPYYIMFFRILNVAQKTKTYLYKMKIDLKKSKRKTKGKNTLITISTTDHSSIAIFIILSVIQTNSLRVLKKNYEPIS